MQGQLVDQQAVRQTFKQFYQNRTPNHHQIVFAVITQAFPKIALEKVKLYSYFAEVPDEKDLLIKIQATKPCYLIQKNQGSSWQSYQIVHRTDLTNFDLNKVTIYISRESKIKCEMLNSIQQQIKWLHNNQYFQQIPKKRLYNMLRQSQLLATTFNNNVYSEGQSLQMGHTSIFLVREGEFCFKKINKHQNLMLYNFGVGQMFGHEELLTDQSPRKRLFTVNCRSSIGVVYKISEDFFNYYLKKSCEEPLRLNIQKVSKFIGKHLQKVQLNRQKNVSLLTQFLSFRKSVSMELNTFLTIPKLSKTQRVVLDELSDLKQKKKENLPSLSVKSVAALDSHAKKQRITMINPQYQQDAKMINKKLKIQALRNYSKSKKIGSRGQILLSLIKNSWHFQRNRRKNLLTNS